MIITKEIFLYIPLVFQIQLGNMGRRKEKSRDFSSLTWFSKLKWLKCQNLQPDKGTSTSRRLCEGVCMHVRSSPTLCDPMDTAHQAPLSMELSKNTGVGCQFLLHGFFLTQGSNLCRLSILHCRQVLYWLSHQVGSCCLSILHVIYV